jgi:phosphotransferase system HPr (HPr) family protein
MRPASSLAELASQFPCEIVVRLEDRQADAKSVLDLLNLNAPYGTVLTIEARGPQAGRAIEAIEELFRNGLYEQQQEPTPSS